MEIQLRLFAGLLCSIAMVKNQKTDSKPPCDIINLKAYCFSRNLTSIPQTLNVELTDMDVSFNPIKMISDEDFKRYKNLLTLKLRGLNCLASNAVEYDEMMFKPLVDLRNLDMNDSPFNLRMHSAEGVENIYWPKKIKFLLIANFQPYEFTYKTLNLSTLSELGELNVSHHKLEKFPLLHPLAPIYWIDLHSNPLNELTAESLAPFCTLLYIRVSETGLQGLESIQKEVACQCHRVEQWMLLHNIRGFEITCAKPNENCEKKKFSVAMLNERKTCLERQPTSNLWKWLLLIALLSLILPGGYIGNEYYKRYKMKKDDSSSATTAPADVSVSAEEDETSESNSELNA